MLKGFDTYQVGSEVEVSTNVRGKLSDFKWVDNTKTFRAKVVGFDSGGYPILLFNNIPVDAGTWSIDNETRALELGVEKRFLKEIPLNKNCLYCALEPNAVKEFAPPKVEPMKHDLKVGDRITVGQERNSSALASNGWSDQAYVFSGTVIGQKSDGTPIVYFDTTGNSFMYSWEYNYGRDLTLIDKSYRDTVNIYDRKFAQLDNANFLKEADYKAGKRIVPSAMNYDAVCVSNKIAINGDSKTYDIREFIRHLCNTLPLDENESHLYGEQFASLFQSEVPQKHEVFSATKVSSAKIANNLRSMFGDGHVVYNGPIDSTNDDLVVEEYLVKWRNADFSKQHKVQVAYPRTGTVGVRHAFGKGRASANSFQMFRKDMLVKHFDNANILEAVKEAVAKQFTLYGDDKAAKVEAEALTKKGFVLKGKIKESKKMAKNDVREADEKTFMEMFTGDFHEAKFRVAADQTTHLIKEGFVKMLNAKGGDSGQVEILKMMLDSEGGEAAIAYLAGIGLTYGPGISNHPQAKRFAKEFRTNGMAKAGNLIAETVMGGLIPILANALASLPAEEQLRVSETSTETRVNADSNEEEDEETETKVEGKKAVA